MSLITEIFSDVKFILSYRNSKMAVQKEINRQAPSMGDPAPDFTLTNSSGAETVTLSDFRGKKPVALVFGSFT